MLAICIEASHKRGMGHFFRMLNIVKKLKKENEDYVVLLNYDNAICDLLKIHNIKHEFVDLTDFNSDWESKIINKYKIDIWLNDRLDTNVKSSEHIKSNKIKLCCIDDFGDGAALADANFLSLVFDENIINKGKKIFKGTEYLILNDEIKKYRRKRSSIDNILITLGGSDTYGVTLKIAEYMKRLNLKATIVVGAAFKNIDELKIISDGFFDIKENVPSLIAEFYNYDLAITGGGITPFEASATGLPCLIVANEIHEISIARYIEQSVGSGVFVNYYKELNFEHFKEVLESVNVEKLSDNGLHNVSLNGLNKVMKEVFYNER